jgi:integrase/recombinase XerD
MPRYAEGTHPPYEPVNHEAALRPLRALGLPEDSRSWTISLALVRHCRTSATAHSYGSELASWLRFCKQNAIEALDATPEDVDQYLATLSGYAMGTQNLKLWAARLFYKRAVEKRWIDTNPVVIPANVRRIPETDTPALSKVQAEMLLGAIRADADDVRIGLTAKRDFALVTLMIRLALRTSEVASLRWGRISESNERQRIAFRGKGSKPAYLVIPDDVAATLQNWREAFEASTGATLGPGDPIFVGVSSRHLGPAGRRAGSSPLRTLSRSGIYQIVTARMADVGLTGARMSPHALRATGAVLAYRGGATIIEIQGLLRHSSVDTTMRYLQKLVGGAAASAIDKIYLNAADWTQTAAIDAPVDPEQAA